MNSPARVLAMNEWIRGERGREGDVFIAGVRFNDTAAATGIVAFQRAEALAESGSTGSQALERLDQLVEDNEHDAVLVAAWGGAEAQQVLEDFVAARKETGREHTMPVLSALRVEHDQVWENTAIELGATDSQWRHAGACPDVAQEMIPRGYKPPAAQPQARFDSLQPAAEPLGSIDPRAAETIRQSRPSDRVANGIECVDALTYAAAEGIEDPGIRASEIQVLSEAVASDTLVRDAVALYAADHPGRTASVIDAYRHAPVENREAMSACAATANALGGGSSEATEILALPASESREHHRMVGMVSYSASRGINPAPIKAQLEESLPVRVQEADTNFIRERDQQVTAQAAALNTTSPGASPGHGPGL